MSTGRSFKLSFPVPQKSIHQRMWDQDTCDHLCVYFIRTQIQMLPKMIRFIQQLHAGIVWWKDWFSYPVAIDYGNGEPIIRFGWDDHVQLGIFHCHVWSRNGINFLTDSFPMPSRGYANGLTRYLSKKGKHTLGSHERFWVNNGVMPRMQFKPSGLKKWVGHLVSATTQWSL